MGLEQRGAYKYYYRKERDASRVKSVYVGRGEIAHMVSDLQSTSGLFEKALNIVYPSKLDELKAQDATIEHACRLIDAMTKASLLSAGFHTHKRQWRRRRYGSSGKESGRTGGSDSEDTSEV